MALLALAATAFPDSVIAATVDHRLRAASVDEALMVADWCHTRAIRHATLSPEKPPSAPASRHRRATPATPCSPTGHSPRAPPPSPPRTMLTIRPKPS
ncbi:hypothetical protein ACVOMT_09310 [Sphingomonas panni]